MGLASSHLCSKSSALPQPYREPYGSRAHLFAYTTAMASCPQPLPRMSGLTSSRRRARLAGGAGTGQGAILEAILHVVWYTAVKSSRSSGSIELSNGGCAVAAKDKQLDMNVAISDSTSKSDCNATTRLDAFYNIKRNLCPLSPLYRPLHPTWRLSHPVTNGKAYQDFRCSFFSWWLIV